MKIIKSLKRLICTLDLFSQQVSFRHNDQPRYQTLTGGCISLILIAVFIGVFMTTFIHTFNKDQITFISTTFDDINPSFYTTSVNNTFMFALGLDGINVNSGVRFFEIYMQFNNYSINGKQKQNVLLEPCTKDVWESIGFGQIFQKLKFSRWLCPPSNLTIQLDGKYTSDNFKFYKIGIKKCIDTNPNRPCASNNTIQSYLNTSQSFTFNFYFVNTILNPGDQNFTRIYLQDSNYFPFSLTQGITSNMYISSYTINTDESLIPLQDISTVQGGIVLNTANILNYAVRNTQYLKIYLRKSPISINIQRNFLRIDDTLSYVGGLFTSILSALGLISLYNQYSYEMDIAKNMFFFQKDQPLNSDSFHLGNFFIYLIYLLFSKIGIKLNWPKFEKFHRFLQQSRKQLDMRLIMKKILYSERLGLAILDKPKYKTLHMQQPLTLNKAEQIREDYQIYQKLRNKYLNQNNVNNIKISDKELIFKRSFAQQTLNNTLTQQNNNFLIDQITMTNDLPLQKFKNQKSQNSLPVNQNSFSQNLSQKSQKLQKSLTEFDKQMQNYLLKLKKDGEHGDKVAKRIFQSVDIKLKNKYIPNSYFNNLSLNAIIIQNELQHDNQTQKISKNNKKLNIQKLSQQKFNKKKLPKLQKK